MQVPLWVFLGHNRVWVYLHARLHNRRDQYNTLREQRRKSKRKRFQQEMRYSEVKAQTDERMYFVPFLKKKWKGAVMADSTFFPIVQVLIAI